MKQWPACDVSKPDSLCTMEYKHAVMACILQAVRTSQTPDLTIIEQPLVGVYAKKGFEPGHLIMVLYAITVATPKSGAEPPSAKTLEARIGDPPVPLHIAAARPTR